MNNYACSVHETSDAKVVIVPHAGYRYSLATAISAFKCLEHAKYKKIIILGFSHRRELASPIGISSFDSLETPFGDLEVWRPTGALSTLSPIPLDVDKEEHCIEMQLPLIKYFLPECKVLPLMVCHLQGQDLMETSAWIASLLTSPDTCMIVTSDFCHWGISYGYHPALGTYPGATMSQRIKAMDLDAVEIIKQNDEESFRTYLNSTRNTICGRNPIRLCMKTLSTGSFTGRWDLLSYNQSSQIQEASSIQSSVSYVAMGFYLD